MFTYTYQCKQTTYTTNMQEFVVWLFRRRSYRNERYQLDKITKILVGKSYRLRSIAIATPAADAPRTYGATAVRESKLSNLSKLLKDDNIVDTCSL